MVGEVNASPHEGSLTGPQDDFMKVHVPIHVEDVCDEVDSTIKDEDGHERYDCEYKSEIWMKLIVPLSPIIWQGK